MADNESSNFIRQIVEEDLRAGRHTEIVTRFPPEPNGYLHIGHAKSICLNFGIAAQYGGRCHLRFDDTNPLKEDVEYVEAIQRDIRWLGFDWGEHLYAASDYFDRLYGVARQLVTDGLAYVDSLDEAAIREYRGTVTEPGRPSPFRDRSIAENLDLLARMKRGEFPDGAHVLRAKIDLASPNMKMRDPLIYRIRNTRHHAAGDWHIYPLYDFAHPLSDAFEGITHSFCTLEFENNRELYDWFVAHADVPSQPRQIEFARLNLGYTVMSKRRLLRLVKEGHVAGWDDPRMPTLAGLRRRGVRPQAIRDFAERVGVARANSLVDVGLLEHAIRDDLNTEAPRVMAVLEPLRLRITDWPDGKVDWLDASYWPHDVPKVGSRKVPFTGTILIERDDFSEEPPPGWKRLAPGREVRLRYGYLVTATEVVRDATGAIVEVRCTHDPASRGGTAPGGRKVGGTLHWVAEELAVPLEVRLYDRLFTAEQPDLEEDLLAALNPASLEVVTARAEPSLSDVEGGQHVQLERLGYFFVDPVDAAAGRTALNRVVALKDSWGRATVTGVEAPQGSPHPDPTRAKQEPPPKRRDRDEVLARLGDRSPVFLHYVDALGLSLDEAEVLAAHPGLAALFDAARVTHDNPRGIAAWIVNDLQRELKERELGSVPLEAEALGHLVALVDAGTITSRVAKEVFAELVSRGGDPRRIVAERGLEQIDDPGVLGPIVDAVVTAHPTKVAAYRGGRHGLLGFFLGEVVQQTRGKANPQRVRELLEARLAR